MMTIEGIGIGLRKAMAEATLGCDLPELRWLEIHPENYVKRGGLFQHNLERALARYPIATHGLTMGFGALEPTEPEYMAALREFLHAIRAPWHSEHLCFSGAGGVALHDLLPLPFSREAVQTAVSRIREARDRLEIEIAVENISYYAQLGAAEMSEQQFLLEVLEGADCKLLLDVNNVFVNSQNHGFDPRQYLDAIPKERVVQIHVAGHLVRDDRLILDTHGENVRDEVYELLEHTLRRIGPVPVLLERDQNFPPFEQIMAEVKQLAAIYERATRSSRASTKAEETATTREAS